MNKVAQILAVAFVTMTAAAGVSAQAQSGGDYTYSVDFALPAGTAGVTPKLGLSYASSNLDNGVAGVGWTLTGLPMIVRRNVDRELRYDGTDDYIGPSGKLIDISGSGRTEFHSQVESWNRYVPQYGACGLAAASEPCAWTVTDNMGNKMTYGATADSFIEARDNAGQSGEHGAAQAWALTAFQDTRGLSYNVEYAKDADTADFYPKSVTYTNGPGIDKQHVVAFEYEARPDTVRRFAGKSVRRADKRLHRVAITVDGKMVRSYVLCYAGDAACSDTPLSPSGLTTLVSIQEVGNDGVSTLPASKFVWNQQPLAFTAKAYRYATSVASNAFRNAPMLVGDIAGQGRSDIARLDRAGMTFYLSDGQGGFTETTKPYPGSSPVDFNAPVQYVDEAIDFTGSGRTDLLRLTSDRMYLFENKGGLEFARHEIRYPNNRVIDGYFPAAVVDLNGDHRPDVIRFSDSYAITFLNNGGGAFTSSIYSFSPSFDSTVPLLTGDFNADGCFDFMRVTSTDFYLFKGDCTGGFVKSIVPHAATSIGHDTAYLTLDVNGDGLPDIVAVATSQVTTFINDGKGGFLPAIKRNLPAGVPELNAAWPKFGGDFNRDGLGDFGVAGDGHLYLLRSLGDGTFALQASQPYLNQRFYANDGLAPVLSGDFIGEGRPAIVRATPSDLVVYQQSGPDYDRIRRVELPNGGATDIEYQNSGTMLGAVQPDATTCGGGAATGYGTACGLADTDTHLLLKSLTTSDGRGQFYKRTYAYANERVWLGPEAEPVGLGFEVIRETAPDGQVTETRYRQDRPFNGQIASVINFAANGQKTNETSFTYEVWGHCGEAGCTLGDQADPKIVVEHTKTIRNFEPITGTLLFTQGEIIERNAFGAAVEQITVENGKETLFTFTKTLNDSALGVVGLAYETWSCPDAACTKVLSHKRTYFDHQPLGSFGGYGNITRDEQLIEGQWEGTDSKFDDYNNAIAVTLPNGMVHKTEFDEYYHAFVVRQTDECGRFIETRTDERYGLPVWTRDPNSLLKEVSLDAFGRVTLVLTRAADDNSVLSRQTTEYASGLAASDANYTRNCAWIKTTPICSISYLDALGHAYKVVNDGDKGLVTTLVDYDAAGRPLRKSEPFYAGQTPHYSVVAYDSAGRIARSTQADSVHSTSVAYNVETLVPGAVTSETTTDANGGVTAIWRDIHGRIVLQTEGAGTEDAADTRHYYNELGLETKIVGPDGSTTLFDYDGAGRLVKKTFPDLGYFLTTLNTDLNTPSYGQLKEERFLDPNTGSSEIIKTFHYDNTGRNTGYTASDGASYVIDYDGPTQYGINKRSHTHYVADGIGVDETYAYDILGNLQTVHAVVTDGSTVLHEYSTGVERDELARVSSVTFPDGTKALSCYGADGRILRELRLDDCATGKLLAAYGEQNAYGRHLSMTTGNGVATTYSYNDANGVLASLQIGAGGQLLFGQDYTFDGQGNLTGINDQVLANRQVSNLRYDALGRLRGVSIGDRDFHYDFDAAGNLINKNGQTQTFNARHQITGVGSDTYTWSDAGVMLSRQRAGVVTAFGYDGGAHLRHVTRNGQDIGQYYYDGSGKRILKIAAGREAGVVTKTYYLGGDYELSEVWRNGSRESCMATTYIGDPEGHKLARLSKAGCPAGAVIGSLPTFEHTLAGMFDGRRPEGAMRKAYHELNALAATPAVAGTMVLAFYALAGALLLVVTLRCVTGSGRRLQRSRVLRMRPAAALLVGAQFFAVSCGFNSPGATSALRSVVGGAAATSSLAADHDLHAGVFYYHNNYQSSVVLVTDADGHEVSRQNFLPFGESDTLFSGRLVSGSVVAAPVASHNLYTGQEADFESDLYYYGARYYDPQIGTFLTADGIAPGDGSASQGLNRYQYVFGNPYKYSDPTGHDPWGDIGKGISSWWKAPQDAYTWTKRDNSVVAHLLYSSLQYTVVGQYEAYRTGGLQNLALNGISTAATAVLQIYTPGVTVSLSYSYKYGYGAGVGYGFGVVGGGLNYNAKTGFVASVNVGYSVGDTGGTLGLGLNYGFSHHDYSASIGASVTQTYSNSSATESAALLLGPGGKTGGSFAAHDTSSDFSLGSFYKALSTNRSVMFRYQGKDYLLTPGFSGTMIGPDGREHGNLPKGIGGGWSVNNVTCYVTDAAMGALHLPVLNGLALGEAMKTDSAFQHVDVWVAHSNGNFAAGTAMVYEGATAPVRYALDPPLSGVFSSLAHEFATAPGTNAVFGGTPFSRAITWHFSDEHTAYSDASKSDPCGHSSACLGKGI